MTNSGSPIRPTASELDILSVLWTRGPSSVREVQEALPDEQPGGYFRRIILRVSASLSARRR